MRERKPQIYGFDDFRLEVENRQLLHDGRPVALASKAFDMLVVLVENGGRLVGKDELFSRVWPEQTVEESNLAVHVSAIRKALGDPKRNPHYVVTVPGHGYRFAGDVLRVDEEEEELVIERHSVSRLTVETEATGAGAAPVSVRRAAGEASSEGRAPSGARNLVGGAERRTPAMRAPAILLVVSAAVVTVAGALITAGLRNSTGQRQPTNQMSQAPQPPGPLQTMKIKRLTSSGKAGSASISPDGRYVVYKDGDAEGRQALWLRQVATGSTLQLVPPDDVMFTGTTFSRDGNHVYYTARVKGQQSGALFRIPVIGGEAKKLLEGVSGPVTQSPDGGQIAFVLRQAGEAVLKVANSDGTQSRPLASLRGSGSFYVHGPAWSPDGETIACGGNPSAGGLYAGVFVVRVEDGTVRQLTPRTWRRVHRVGWLGDGSGLVILAVDAEQDFTQLWEVSYPKGEARRITNDLNGHGQISLGLTADSKTLVTQQEESTSYIWIARTDGGAGGARQLTSGDGRNDGRFGLTWAPDGTLIYAAMIDGGWNLWRVKQDGSGQVQLTDDAYMEAYPAAALDGRTLVFRSTREDGKQSLWRMGLDGGAPERLTSGEQDHAARVSPDGSWVMYCALNGGGERLWKVPAGGGVSTQLTDYVSQWPDVSPDGKLIAYTFYDEQAQQPRWRGAVMPFAGGPPVKTFDLPPSANLRIRWTADASAVAYIDTHNGISNIWSQPVDGGPPKQLTDFESGLIYNFDISRDGRLFAYARGSSTGDVILITDFR
jgi:Tol biopolymer transport system component/DNA-binding winged helix-turn-helix (wHTH) protein